KGYHSLLKPAVEQLQSEGLNIELVLADRQLGFIPHDEMVKYYSQIDVYVCPSKIEGTPNPVLESMACGVPVISTDVGVVKDAFGEMQKEWI
ncbi:TPA: glycosyltransferase, partial [Escherichia coli]|nr:glycosyltransferase [Escherichia coli]